MSESKIFVYVQAIPTSLSSSRMRSFEDLRYSNFKLTYSSKILLSKASGLGPFVALGHSSVLSEAIARGADDVMALPLSDNPLSQAESIAKKVPLSDCLILVGENGDGPFSGAALAGALTTVCDLGLKFGLDKEDELGSLIGKVVFVKDDPTVSTSVDIRRIDKAFKNNISESETIGKSSIEKREGKPSPTVLVNRPLREVATTIVRKLRRLS